MRSGDLTVVVLGSVVMVMIVLIGLFAMWHGRAQAKCSVCNQFRECVPVCIECLRKTDKGIEGAE